MSSEDVPCFSVSFSEDLSEYPSVYFQFSVDLVSTQAFVQMLGRNEMSRTLLQVDHTIPRGHTLNVEPHATHLESALNQRMHVQTSSFPPHPTILSSIQ